MTDGYPMRINKYLAHRGIATRKDADVLIGRGLVHINGRRAVLGDKVNEHDVVEAKAMRTKYRYFAYYKPLDVVTHSPQYGEKDIQRSIPLRSLFPIGRLDKRSSGLIILTDDARITDRLLNPKFEHEKEYLVTTKEELPKQFKKRMESGVNIGGPGGAGYMTKRCKVDVRGFSTFAIILSEGKKHQIRRMCDALKVSVDTLERVRVMNIKLGSLKPNDYRELDGTEKEQFLRSLGL